MNQLATWFGVITKQAIRRGTFKSVAHLIRRINDYIANWNSALDAGLARQPGDPLAVDQQALTAGQSSVRAARRRSPTIPRESP